LPITIVTLGLFIFVVNALMLMLAAALVDGFEVKGFSSALWGSVVLGVMNLLVGMLFG
jgi:putative membrane protein